MEISATGKFLTGPFLRPDIKFTSEHEYRDPYNHYQHFLFSSTSANNEVKIIHDEHRAYLFDSDFHTNRVHHIDWMNLCGIVPGLSTLTGTIRSLVGLIHAVVHLAKWIFLRKEAGHAQEALLGAYNVGRGGVEIVPILGNIVVGIFDYYRYHQLQQFHKAEENRCLSNYPRFGIDQAPYLVV